MVVFRFFYVPPIHIIQNSLDFFVPFFVVLFFVWWYGVGIIPGWILGRRDTVWWLFVVGPCCTGYLFGPMCAIAQVLAECTPAVGLLE